MRSTGRLSSHRHGEMVIAYSFINATRANFVFSYGTEPAVGKAIKESGVPRSELFVTSKLWNNKHHPDDVGPALQETLDDLGLEYLDLFLMHWPVAFKRGDDMFPQDKDGNMITDDIDYVDVSNFRPNLKRVTDQERPTKRWRPYSKLAKSRPSASATSRRRRLSVFLKMHQQCQQFTRWSCTPGYNRRALHSSIRNWVWKLGQEASPLERNVR